MLQIYAFFYIHSVEKLWELLSLITDKILPLQRPSVMYQYAADANFWGEN